MWLQKSIKRKMVAAVGLCFLGTILFVIGYCTFAMHTITRQEKEGAYSLQLETIHAGLQKRYDKLVSSGMVELYEKQYQKSQIDELSATYYHEGIKSYPFIVNGNQNVIMHPTLGSDSQVLQQSQSFRQLVAQGQGQGTFRMENQDYWAVFKTFEPWHWTLVYAISKHDELQAVSAFIRNVLMVLLLVMLTVSIAMHALIRRLIAPLTSVISAMQEIATGDLTRQVHVHGHDEIRTLADHFNSMVNNFKLILANAQSVAWQINDSGREIHAVSEKQAAGAAEHAHAVSETAAAAAELSKANEHIGVTIQGTSRMAEHILIGMEKIKITTDQTNQIMISLNDKSKQIGKITMLIDAIASQTNLLAVNAAIEAARAGEHGRGFTVVADQINKLADSTAKSTKDITALVALIQHEMTNATQAMDKSITEVEEEIKLTKESAATSREIAVSVHQQIQGSQQIAQSMVGIQETMHEIVNGAKSSADSAEKLTTLAEDLKKTIAQFKAGKNPLPQTAGKK